MHFTVQQRVSELSKALGRLDRTRRTAFAAWCCEPLFDEFFPHLASRIGDAQAERLKCGFEHVWTSIVKGNTSDEVEIRLARDVCMTVSWDSSDSDSRDFGAEELIGCLERVFDTFLFGSSQRSAECAERVINWIDYQITMVMGIKESFIHPLMKAEVHTQDRMIGHLQNAKQVVVEDHWRFRKGG